MGKFVKNLKRRQTDESTEISQELAEQCTSRASPQEDPSCERQNSTTKKRKYKQKYKAEWENKRPWLTKLENEAFCKLCQKSLSNDVFNLDRHESSAKHHQKVVSLQEDPFEQNQIIDTLDNISPIQYKEEEEELGKLDSEQRFKKTGTNKLKASTPKQVTANGSKSHRKGLSEGRNFKLDRFKLLKRIDRDRDALNEYYLVRKKQSVPPSVQQQNKDTFDLFFDSVSATVKSLPPKLGAELKGRISQLIAEFELRAICEREAQECSAALPSTTTDSNTLIAAANATHHSQDLMNSSVTQESAVIDPNTGVPHIVYSFKPKTT